MFKSFLFEKFKSFTKAELSIEQISILIGSNSSGKTNAIEGIKILSELATGREISVILDGSKNTDSDIRGGSRGCAQFTLDQFTLGCTFCIDGETYAYKITIRIATRIYVEAEELRQLWDTGSKVVFRTKRTNRDSADIKVEYDNGKKGRNPDVFCIRTMAVLPQMIGRLPIDEGLRHERDIISTILRELRNILFLDPVPSQMRSYARINDNELRPNAENISAVLYNLCEVDKNKEQNKTKILAMIQSLPENEIQNIEFINTKLGDVIFALQEKYGKTSMDAKRLSDGTLRCISVITALISEMEGSMVVIEEVDNGIHPSRVSRMLSMIAELAEEKALAVLITTHNPALLNAVGRGLLGGVSLCYRNAEDGGSSFQRLVDIPDYFRLAAKGPIGDLLTNDELSPAAKHGKQTTDYDWMGLGL